MLVEDTAAFIEQLEVREADRRAKKRTRRLTRAELDVMRGEVEARLAGDALWRLASQLAVVRELEDAKGERALIREIEMVRGRLRVAREKLQECRLRLERAERDATLDDGDGRRVKVFRLHSARHHLECSERRFARLASAQVDRPVLVATREGRHWWWYLDRFWWDDEGLSARDVATLVLRTRPSTAAAGERARARPGERSRARASAAARGGRGLADREVRGLVPGSRPLRRLPVDGGSRVRPDRPFLEGRPTVDRQRRAALCGMPRPADAQHRPHRGEPRADRVDGVRALAVRAPFGGYARRVTIDEDRTAFVELSTF